MSDESSAAILQTGDLWYLSGAAMFFLGMPAAYMLVVVPELAKRGLYSSDYGFEVAMASILGVFVFFWIISMGMLSKARMKKRSKYAK